MRFEDFWGIEPTPDPAEVGSRSSRNIRLGERRSYFESAPGTEQLSKDTQPGAEDSDGTVVYMAEIQGVSGPVLVLGTPKFSGADATAAGVHYAPTSAMPEVITDNQNLPPLFPAVSNGIFIGARSPDPLFQMDPLTSELSEVAIPDADYVLAMPLAMARNGTAFVVVWDTDGDYNFYYWTGSVLTLCGTIAQASASAQPWLQAVPSLTADNEVIVAGEFLAAGELGIYRVNTTGVTLINTIELDNINFPSIDASFLNPVNGLTYWTDGDLVMLAEGATTGSLYVLKINPATGTMRTNYPDRVGTVEGSNQFIPSVYLSSGDIQLGPSGTLYFTGGTTTGSNVPIIIYTMTLDADGIATGPTELFDTSDVGAMAYYCGFAVNENGTVALWGDRVDGGYALYLYDGNAVSQIVLGDYDLIIDGDATLGPTIWWRSASEFCIAAGRTTDDANGVATVSEDGLTLTYEALAFSTAPTYFAGGWGHFVGQESYAYNTFIVPQVTP